jgi:2'-5' RNA ligase
MRLFVAVWPSPEAIVALEGLAQPDHQTVRWTTRDQWHVTLRFLGEVPEEDLAEVTQAVQEVAARSRPRRVELGPLTIRLGRRALAVPVAGLDDLAAAVVTATRAIGEDPEARRFRGHVTLARSRGGRPLPPALAGQPVRSGWVADEITLVRSYLGHGGPRYETLTVAALAAN